MRKPSPPARRARPAAARLARALFLPPRPDHERELHEVPEQYRQRARACWRRKMARPTRGDRIPLRALR